MQGNQLIDDHVARAGIKGKNIQWAPIGGKDSDVTDASDVLYSNTLALLMEQKVVNIRS
ncbi:hypothetical protein SDC9_80423 [bioreactor metagenome]|uniref:Uncharacterized protein n=1 Tax=bioreactor metagenome TaxID=1076179 RepID=A0A644YZD9_9ZZZZ